MKDDTPAFEKVKSDFGLPVNFNVNSIPNLLPAHRRCNRLKSNQVFHPARARYFLELVSAKEPTVHRYIQALALQSRKEQVLAAVQAAFETGTITINELVALDSERGAFPLTRSLEFVDGAIEGSIRPDEIEELLDKPVLIGGTTSIDGLEYVHDTGGRMVVHTCREYRTAIAAGYYPLTNFSIKMTAFLSAANAIIDGVSKARVASVSYVSNPFVGVADLRLLPKELLPCIGPDMSTVIDNLRERSLAELALSGDLQVISISSNRLQFEWNGAGAVLTELLRADLDGDEIEELLVQQYTYAVGGSLGFDYIGTLRRIGPDEMFMFASSTGDET